MKIILDLCGGTGAWSNPYSKDNNYKVYNITFPDFDVTEERIVKMCIDLKPYGILCANPCECWGIMGNVRWKERTKEFIVKHSQILIKNLRIIYESNPFFWCIENPPGKMKLFLGEPKYIFDAFDYGENYHKKTYLWGKFNIPNKPQDLPLERKVIKDFIRQGPKDGRNSSVVRGITPLKFAQAFYKANL